MEQEAESCPQQQVPMPMDGPMEVSPMEVEMDEQQVSDAMSFNRNLAHQTVDHELLSTPSSYYRFVCLFVCFLCVWPCSAGNSYWLIISSM